MHFSQTKFANATDLESARLRVIHALRAIYFRSRGGYRSRARSLLQAYQRRGSTSVVGALASLRAAAFFAIPLDPTDLLVEIAGPEDLDDLSPESWDLLWPCLDACQAAQFTALRSATTREVQNAR